MARVKLPTLNSEEPKALVQRGSLTLWISEEVLAAWHHRERTGRLDF